MGIGQRNGTRLCVHGGPKCFLLRNRNSVGCGRWGQASTRIDRAKRFERSCSACGTSFTWHWITNNAPAKQIVRGAWYPSRDFSRRWNNGLPRCRGKISCFTVSGSSAFSPHCSDWNSSMPCARASPVGFYSAWSMKLALDGSPNFTTLLLRSTPHVSQPSFLPGPPPPFECPPFGRACPTNPEERGGIRTSAFLSQGVDVRIGHNVAFSSHNVV